MHNGQFLHRLRIAAVGEMACGVVGADAMVAGSSVVHLHVVLAAAIELMVLIVVQKSKP